TMHVYGTGRSGEEIELYQTIYIGEVPKSPQKTTSTQKGVQPVSHSAVTLARAAQTPVYEGKGQATETVADAQTPEVKGVTTVATQPTTTTITSREEVKLKPWWIGAGIVLGCAAFLLWFILKKPKL